MLSRVNDLFRVINAFGGAQAVLRLGPVVFGVLSDLREADESREYFAAAIRIVTPLAPLTSTDWDDGLLIALHALNQDPDFHAWLDAKLADGDDLLELDDDGVAIPDGALAIRYGIQNEEDLGTIPANAQAFNVGAAVPLLLKYLPVIIELVRQLRGARQDLQREGLVLPAA